MWKKIRTIKEEGILRGLGLVGYCPNSKCLNYERIKMISCGFGKFDNEKLHKTLTCEICPRKDQLPVPYVMIGVFFKDCKWVLEGYDNHNTGATPVSILRRKKVDNLVRGVKKQKIGETLWRMSTDLLSFGVYPIGKYLLYNDTFKRLI